MVHILAKITFRPDTSADARALLLRLVADTRKEPGCLAYELYQQADQPHVFQTVERWRDQAAADEHLQTVHVAAAFAAAGPSLAAAPEIVAFKHLA